LPIGIAAHGATTAVARFTVTTANGVRAFAVALGALAPSAARQGFRLAVIDVGAAPWTIAFPPPL
jgi:hypothetical protein